MSVPLDRLYNFLHDVCNRDDIIIYRFFPHGSRKISDLTRLQRYGAVDKRLKKFVIFHDQEPLNFDLYTDVKMFDELLSNSAEYSILSKFLTDDLYKKCLEVLKRIIPSQNLKIVFNPFTYDAAQINLVILVHSEQRSQDLQRYQSNKFIPVYWWSHALIARDWFRYAKHDRALDQPTPTKEFLIYNRAWSGTREYRLKFTELLVKNNLADHCMTWFSPVDDQHYTLHKFKNPSLQIDNYALENYFDSTSVASTASADYCVTDYQQTKIEVVLETLFDDERLHLTEKTLRPIACGHPFILGATHGSLKYLRDYGFETFSPWINESYDNIEDPAQRLEAIVQEMKRIADLSEDEKTFLYAGLKDITIRNKKLFFSDQWQQRIVDEYKINFDQAITQFNQV